MDKNDYVNRYISLHRSQNQVEKNIDELSFRTDGLSICPAHFNYFYFKVVTFNGTPTLTVKDARRLGEWLIKATEGIENAHGIIEEIIK